ncbi:DUF4124 domain-containing protein [Thiohalophilus thiocyanatoxydans]|uniref:Uncharacterized protein DUF4124 n=1 Tax=Thiohalophilus thiocyanatoxydans TaxID=381308 RepID=A0A4R8IEP3_9GAMM|nr:DUF4124 domain-containing protein [Thiohalophilus thiocyanatoxydans]TDX96882.1 uncharacterized protein DUF4124 [Thiohalophilus thiocyanatoxydans]
MKRRSQQIGTALMLVLMLLAPAGAEIFKWTDDQGRVHYGDRPPDEDARSVDVDPGTSTGSPAPSDAERREKTRRLLRAYDEERRIKQQQVQQHQAREAERKQRCVRARDRLKQYRHAGALYDLDEQGNRQFLEHDQRRQAEARAAQDVDKWCN